MKGALDSLRNVHAEVKQEFNSTKAMYAKANFSDMSAEQTRAIMIECEIQDILNNIHCAIRKMEILTKHLY